MSRSSRRRGWCIDSKPTIDLVFFCMTDLPFCQPIFFVWFNAESILLFLHQQPDVAHLAAVYLKYTSIGLPAYAFNCISRYDLDPTKGNQLTFFQSIFPITGSLHNPNTDYSRDRAYQRNSQLSSWYGVLALT